MRGGGEANADWNLEWEMEKNGVLANFVPTALMIDMRANSKGGFHSANRVGFYGFRGVCKEPFGQVRAIKAVCVPLQNSCKGFH